MNTEGAFLKSTSVFLWLFCLWVQRGQITVFPAQERVTHFYKELKHRICYCRNSLCNIDHSTVVPLQTPEASCRGGCEEKGGDVIWLIQYSSMPQWPAGTTSYFQHVVGEKTAHQSHCLSIIIIIIGVRTISTAELSGLTWESLWSIPTASLTNNNVGCLFCFVSKAKKTQTAVDWCFTSKREITKMGQQRAFVPLAVSGIHPLGFSIVFPKHAHTMQWIVCTWQSYLLGRIFFFLPSGVKPHWRQSF